MEIFSCSFRQMMGRLFSCGIVLSIFSCQKVFEQDRSVPDYYKDYDRSEHFVDLETVINFTERLYPHTKGDNTSGFNVLPIVGTDSDTLMYIVNYGAGRGWKIFSADSRTPAVIAESDRGSFSLETGNEGLRVWMDGVSKNMEIIRHSEDAFLNFSRDEIIANKSFWNKEEGRGIHPPVFEAQGEWHVSTHIETFVSDSLNHMTPKWYQREPYNDFCPLKTNGTVDRAKVGCVAVAGAQVLYYLHGKFGIPQTMVSSGYCVGDINNYTQSFFNPSSTVWASMDTTFHNTSGSGGAERIMIGHVTNLVDSHFHNSYTWALPANLRTNVFEWYGYSCSHGNYDDTVVKASLEADLPVIITATDLLIPTDGDIHTFVIDGYKSTYKKYIYHHYWVPYNPETFIYLPEYDDYYTISYSSPAITSIKMNWGWDSQWDKDNPLNDGWFSLTDSWIVFEGTSLEYDYNYHRKMIYGFTVTE